MLKSIEKTSYLVSESDSTASFKDRVLNNDPQIVFVTDSEHRLVGSITPGDLERYQKVGGSLEIPAVDCMCSNPVIIHQGEQRRNVIRLFDQKVHAIPEVDDMGRLISVITVNDYKFPNFQSIVARSKSPVRISFSGGGTDLSYYFSQNGGMVLNTTICKYAHATLVKRQDSKIIIYSGDYDIQEEIGSIDEIDYKGDLALIKAVIKLLQPEFGFNLITFSEVPPGSGLGGSSVIASAIIGCFNKFRDDELTPHEIAELAFQAERIELGIQGGWQDQYATVFGGFNFIEFSKDDTVVHPLRLHAGALNELESNLILCYSGKSRNSGTMHEKQAQNFQKNKKEMLPMMQESKAIATEMKNCLLKGNITEFGRLVDRAWFLKKQYSSSISDSSLDKIYQLAKDNGALGGKILGAGGGGYFLFCVKSLHRNRLENSLREIGLTTEPVSFDKIGLRSWITKERY